MGGREPAAPGASDAGGEAPAGGGPSGDRATGGPGGTEDMEFPDLFAGLFNALAEKLAEAVEKLEVVVQEVEEGDDGGGEGRESEPVSTWEGEDGWDEVQEPEGAKPRLVLIKNEEGGEAEDGGAEVPGPEVESVDDGPEAGRAVDGSPDDLAAASDDSEERAAGGSKVIDLDAERRKRRQVGPSEFEQRLGRSLGEGIQRYLVDHVVEHAEDGTAEVRVDGEFLKKHGAPLLGTLFDALAKAFTAEPGGAGGPREPEPEVEAAEPEAGSGEDPEPARANIDIQINLDLTDLIRGLFEKDDEPEP